MSQRTESFESLDLLAAELRQKLEQKKHILLYAYNGTSKTRLSMAFKDLGMLAELYQAQKSDRLYTYHFSMLRSLLEKSANFHGFKSFSDCLKQDENDTDGEMHARLISILNHGGYSHFEPVEMLEENKIHFKTVFNNFLSRYTFNPDLFPETPEEEDAS